MGLETKSGMGLGSGLGMGLGHGHAYAVAGSAVLGSVLAIGAGVLLVGLVVALVARNGNNNSDASAENA